MAQSRAFGLTRGYGGALGSIVIAAGGVLSGALPKAAPGQPYDQTLTVTPPGAAVPPNPTTDAVLAAHNISHDGFGRFTSASVVQ